MHRHISRLIAATAVLAIVSTTAATGAASAEAAARTQDRAPQGQTKVKPKSKQPKRTSSSARRPGFKAPSWYRPGITVSHVEPTGNGPANQAQCDEIAANIETALVAFDDYWQQKDYDRAEGMLDAVGAQMGNALEQGCDVDF